VALSAAALTLWVSDGAVIGVPLQAPAEQTSETVQPLTSSQAVPFAFTEQNVQGARPVFGLASHENTLRPVTVTSSGPCPAPGLSSRARPKSISLTPLFVSITL